MESEQSLTLLIFELFLLAESSTSWVPELTTYFHLNRSFLKKYLGKRLLFLL